MNPFLSLFNWGLLAVTLSLPASASPLPQAASGQSKLVEFSGAPAPAVSFGGSGDFVSIDSTSKLFKLGGVTRYFAGEAIRADQIWTGLIRIQGTNTWWLPYTTTNTDVDKILGEIKSVSFRDSALPFCSPLTFS